MEGCDTLIYVPAGSEQHFGQPARGQTSNMKAGKETSLYLRSILFNYTSKKQFHCNSSM